MLASEDDMWGQPTWRVGVLAWPPLSMTGGARVRAWQSGKRGGLIRGAGDRTRDGRLLDEVASHWARPRLVLEMGGLAF